MSREADLKLVHGAIEILEVATTDVAASQPRVALLGHEKARVRRTGAMLACDIARMLAMAVLGPIVDAYRDARRVRGRRP